MELELDESASISVIGDTEITLPDYMTMLPQDELDECKTADSASYLIIAAGRHPNGDIVALNAQMQFYTLKHGVFGEPGGQITPIDHGLTLRIDEHDFEIASDWFVDKARKIDITYLTHEGKTE